MGITAGVIVSLLGSVIVGFNPYLPFIFIFSYTVIPSALIFALVSYLIKPNLSKFKYWLIGLITLFGVGLFSFFIHNYLDYRAIRSQPGEVLNWDAIILFNILYSLGVALLFSPLSYFVLKEIAIRKEKSTEDNRT